MAEDIQVLCVDDEAELLEIGKRLLERGGQLSVDTALSAPAALAILKKKSYDAIVADYYMPDMDGIQFLKHIRAEKKTIPFILFTGRGREEVAIEALNNGADFYLQKGGEPKIVYSELDHVIRQSVMMQRARLIHAEQEEQFHSMFERHDSIMLLIEPETGKIIDANLAAERFYGRTRIGLCSLSIDDINALPPDNIAAKRMKAVDAKSSVFTFPHRIASGEIRTVEVRSSPITMKGRTILFSIINDITEQKLAEEALKQANKKLNLLSSITRHDINNQLLTLNGFISLLHDKNPDPALDHYFSRVTQAISRISAMIRFTKEYEQVGIHAPLWQDLQILVNDAEKTATPGSVVIRNDLPAGTEVFADPLITRVFFNLIDNALRHGSRLTTIRFSLETRDNNRIIVCEDDGEGIPHEIKEQIFDRGFGKNTGFGLFISRQILDITGITITETGTPGTGARFEIAVPKEQFRLLQH
jgi:PAS domain S-box-containing protein